MNRLGNQAVEATRTAGTITIVRASRPKRDKYRSYQILIDGSTVGKVARGGKLKVTVPSGRYVVWIVIDRCFRSQKISVMVPPGGDTQVFARPGGSMLGAVFALFCPRHYLSLKVRKD